MFNDDLTISANDFLFGCNCLCSGDTAGDEEECLEARNPILDCTDREKPSGLYLSCLNLDGDAESKAEFKRLAKTVLNKKYGLESMKEDKIVEKKGHLITKKDCNDFLFRYVGFMSPDVVRVIFNPPATIVFWMDGSKTVVKCAKGEKFDPYTGFCYAYTERYFGPLSHIKKVCQKRSTGMPEASKSILKGTKEETERTSFEKQAVAYMRRAICDKFSDGWSIDQIAKRFKMSDKDICEALGKEFE
nr:MAG TPA: Mor transcription activator family [Caudoviricetes sp.]